MKAAFLVPFIVVFFREAYAAGFADFKGQFVLKQGNGGCHQNIEFSSADSSGGSNISFTMVASSGYYSSTQTYTNDAGAAGGALLGLMGGYSAKWTGKGLAVSDSESPLGKKTLWSLDSSGNLIIKKKNDKGQTLCQYQRINNEDIDPAVSIVDSGRNAVKDVPHNRSPAIEAGQRRRISRQ